MFIINPDASEESLPVEYSRFAPRMLDLQARHATGEVMVEQEWGFRRDWTPTGFHDEDCWCRSKLDVFDRPSKTHAHGHDWKSGRRYPPKHIQQEQVYVLSSFCLFPELETMDFSFWYLDEGKKAKREEDCMTLRHYTRKDVPRLMDNYTRRGRAMTLDTVFRPAPSRINCQFCDYNETCEWSAIS